ncbi:helix-turn-helix transcriptional regulator [Thiocapsa rosea]|uniref:AlpA family transcriptional regulator n=1 Tax=Thiocapsa rosea TaxID=69360 RepID=A0A495VC95_9GAMM|nr:AlpA family phage regulatory protein [Thiocapsa rosea]RKT47016.1 AlpA family transcriptional regulator [Thiocapsa rosea]
MPTSVLRLRTVLERTGYSRSVVYARIAAGLFPRPIALGARAAAWPEHDIEAVLAALIRAATEDELRTLVSGIHAQRSTFGLGADERATAVTQAAGAMPAPASRRAG